MTDNPYAAPESLPLANPTAHVPKGIRSVAKCFRNLGWIVIAIYGPVTLLHINELINILVRDQSMLGADLTEMRFRLVFAMGAAIGFAGLVYIGWLYVRDGRALLTQQPGAYRSALFLSYLMLLFFPLILLSAYCVVQLRRHRHAFDEAPPKTLRG